MNVEIKPSDLQYKYPKNHDNRAQSKFAGLPDNHPFDRDDLYEVIPMFEWVMTSLNANNEVVLHKIEEVVCEMPGFIYSRGDVYRYLCETLGQMLGIEQRQ